MIFGTTRRSSFSVINCHSRAGECARSWACGATPLSPLLLTVRLVLAGSLGAFSWGHQWVWVTEDRSQALYEAHLQFGGRGFSKWKRQPTLPPERAAPRSDSSVSWEGEECELPENRMAGLAPGCRRYVTSREDAAAGHEIILLRRACGGWAACWPDGSVRLVRLGQGNVRRIFSEPADGVALV